MPSVGSVIEDQVLAVRSGVAELRLDLGAVHDARVALRQLRATLDVFAPVLEDVPSDLTADLRWFSRQVATTRDAEVVTENLEPRLDVAEPVAARVLTEHLATWGFEASEAARTALEHPRTDALMVGLGRLHLMVPAVPQVYLDLRTQRLVVRVLEDLCDDLPLALGDRHDSRARRARRLHSCRKQVKAARAVLALLDTPPEIRSRVKKSLRELQDLLGEHHDAHVTREWLGRVAQREPATADLARTLRAQERATMSGIEEQLPRVVNRLLERVVRVRRTPGVRPSSP
ncbi:MAG: domain containing protein [Frankiales bacterium]|nr:domain containing protein [Frankiales bacterium]